MIFGRDMDFTSVGDDKDAKAERHQAPTRGARCSQSMDLASREAEEKEHDRLRFLQYTGSSVKTEGELGVGPSGSSWFRVIPSTYIFEKSMPAPNKTLRCRLVNTVSLK